MADETLDPRYDPMFQRGYTPGTAAPARRAAQDTTEAPAPYIPPLTSRTSAPAAPAAPGSSAGSRASVSAPGETAAHAELRARAEAAAAAPLAPATVESDAGARRDPRRNPFLWAVLVVGVVLIAAGIGLLQDLGRQLTDTGTGTATNYLQLQFEMSASPLAIALGIAAILAVLLVYAADWQRRR